MNQNPYRVPESDIITHTAPGIEQLRNLARGQKLAIYSILLGIALRVVIFLFFFNASEEIPLALEMASGIFNLIIAFIGIWGMVLMCKNLGYGVLPVILSVVAMLFIPLIGLIILVIFSVKSSNKLKEAGYKVGLFGLQGNI